jgi:hypothetical protein
MLMLPGLLLPIIFIIMLIITGINEGWRKFLTIAGLFLGSVFLSFLALAIMGIPRGAATPRVIGMLLWGIWVLGLTLYNIKEGYLGNFR